MIIRTGNGSHRGIDVILEVRLRMRQGHQDQCLWHLTCNGAMDVGENGCLAAFADGACVMGHLVYGNLLGCMLRKLLIRLSHAACIWQSSILSEQDTSGWWDKVYYVHVGHKLYPLFLLQSLSLEYPAVQLHLRSNGCALARYVTSSLVCGYMEMACWFLGQSLAPWQVLNAALRILLIEER